MKILSQKISGCPGHLQSGNPQILTRPQLQCDTDLYPPPTPLPVIRQQVAEQKHSLLGALIKVPALGSHCSEGRPWFTRPQLHLCRSLRMAVFQKSSPFLCFMGIPSSPLLPVDPSSTSRPPVLQWEQFSGATFGLPLQVNFWFTFSGHLG